MRDSARQTGHLQRCLVTNGTFRRFGPFLDEQRSTWGIGPGILVTKDSPGRVEWDGAWSRAAAT